MKKYDGLCESLYKKLELYLYRLFCLEKYVEEIVKYPVINMPRIEEVIDPKGHNGEYVRIPPNPFTMRGEDEDIFYTMFEDLYCRSENDRDIKELFIEIWKRIGEVKKFVGITRNTRYCGEAKADKRLVNEIDLYIKFPEVMPSIYAVVFGNIPEDEHQRKTYIKDLRAFQHFLKDREPVREGEVKSYQYYNNKW